MSQVTNPERDAIDPSALGQAVRTYMLATDRDEADVALEAVLVYQAVMAPHEAIQGIEVARAGGTVGVIIYFEHDEIIFVDINGDVALVTCD